LPRGKGPGRYDLREGGCVVLSINGIFGVAGALLLIALVYVLTKNYKGTAAGVNSLGNAGTDLIKAATGQS
jgi:hypothetical protein